MPNQFALASGITSASSDDSSGGGGSRQPRDKKLNFASRRNEKVSFRSNRGFCGQSACLVRVSLPFPRLQSFPSTVSQGRWRYLGSWWPRKVEGDPPNCRRWEEIGEGRTFVRCWGVIWVATAGEEIRRYVSRGVLGCTGGRNQRSRLHSTIGATIIYSGLQPGPCSRRRYARCVAIVHYFVCPASSSERLCTITPPSDWPKSAERFSQTHSTHLERIGLSHYINFQDPKGVCLFTAPPLRC